MFVDLINGSAEAQISGSGWVHVGYDGCSKGRGGLILAGQRETGTPSRDGAASQAPRERN